MSGTLFTPNMSLKRKVLLGVAGAVTLVYQVQDAHLIYATAAIFVMLGVMVAYWLPAIVAYSKGAQSANGIAFLNTLIGWTVVGWIMCLAMAIMTQPSPKVLAYRAVKASLR